MLTNRPSPSTTTIRTALLSLTINLLSIQTATISSKPGGRRPKKKIYHRDADLDKAIDLQKKPALLLRLRSLIATHHPRPLLIRDLEKHVGIIHKWNLISLIQRHPNVFKVSGGAAARSSISVSLTAKADRISAEESAARRLMEPILIKNLKKLLMMSLDCQIPLEKIRLIESDLGLPEDFENSLIARYPQTFSIRNLNGIDHICLESWDSSLAITEREERLDLGCPSKPSKALPRDGNFPGPFAFRMKFAPGFRPNVHYLEEVRKWQKMAFPSPYLNARRVEPGTPQARKRAVAVLHELLSLMMEKRLTSDKLDEFHREYQLPCRLLLCLVKNHGIFYITNKGSRSTVILKEAYDGSELVDKCPLLRFNDKFVSLIGRTCVEIASSNALPV